jgi:hypothetical protein
MHRNPIPTALLLSYGPKPAPTRIRDSIKERFLLLAELESKSNASAYLSGQGSFSNRFKWPFPDAFIVACSRSNLQRREFLRELPLGNFPNLCVIVLPVD